MQFSPNAPLYFIRHGETDWNIERRFQGQSDIPLNQRGLEQARENANHLTKLLNGPANSDQELNIVSSPLLRALKTAEIIRNQLGSQDAEIKTEKGLKEVSFGQWEGLTSPEAKQQFYEARQNRRKDRWAIAPPGGESFAERVDGVAAFLNRLPAHSIVVSHSGIMRIIAYLLADLSSHDAVNLEIPHIGVHVWDGKCLNIAGKSP